MTTRKSDAAVLERRTLPLGEADVSLVRADEEDKGTKFSGHAAVFNQRTAIGNPLRWGFYEEVAPGAFTKTLQEGDARFLVDHDTRMVMARESAGDLRLSEDKVGLAVDADMDTELSYVRDFVRNVEKRRITGMSFGFRVIKDDWKTESVETNDGNTAEVEVRTILEAQLLEVSGVTFPAYEQTDAGLRKMCEEIRSAHKPETSPDAQSGDHEPGESTRDENTEPAETTQAVPALLARMTDLAHREQR